MHYYTYNKISISVNLLDKDRHGFMVNLYCCSDIRWDIEDVSLPGSADVKTANLPFLHMVDDVWNNDFWNPEVIENYMVPEVSWVLGPWDTSACECGTNGALEVAEVTCSRGSWLLCSGAVAGGWPQGRLVGIQPDRLGIPRPSSERPCRHCLGESTLVRFSEMRKKRCTSKGFLNHLSFWAFFSFCWGWWGTHREVLKLKLNQSSICYEAFPSWILPTALGVAFCCCGPLGCCSHGQLDAEKNASNAEDPWSISGASLPEEVDQPVPGTRSGPGIWRECCREGAHGCKIYDGSCYSTTSLAYPYKINDIFFCISTIYTCGSSCWWEEWSLFHRCVSVRGQRSAS